MQPKKPRNAVILLPKGDTPPPRKISLQLTKIGHCRAELAQVYRLAKSGEMDTAIASRLCYILVALSKMIEGDTLESRIEALELQAGKKSGNGLRP